MANPLISAAELRSRLGEVTVLDVRYRTGAPSGHAEFAAGHIPGAAYVDLDQDLAGPPGEKGRHPLPDPDRFIAAMQRVGVGLEGGVVVYDDWSGQAAARAWWLLRHYGHHDVRVLDGGWSAWRSVGGDVETGETQPARGGFHGRPGSMGVVDAASVPSVDVLVDARAPERHRGEVEPIDPVAGHIPTAISAPFDANLGPDGRMKSAAELRGQFASFGIVVAGSGPEAVMSCGSGTSACHHSLAMRVAGLPDPILYVGSYSDWSRSGEAIATGADPGTPA